MTNIKRISDKMYQLEVKSTNMAQRIEHVGLKKDYEVLLSNYKKLKGEIRDINSKLSKQDEVIEAMQRENLCNMVLHATKDVYI
jgi:hypothetical protein